MRSESSTMSPQQIDGYNEQITMIREKGGCDQCHAHRTLLLLKPYHTAYASGQRRACRELLSVPHSCNADGMVDFLDGKIVSAPKGIEVSR